VWGIIESEVTRERGHPVSTTRHYGASSHPSAGDRERLARLRDRHQLPERGQNASSDRMLDSIEQIVTAGTGMRYEVNKLADWMARLPVRAEAAKIEDWQAWPPDLLDEIADDVLLRGYTPERTALRHSTTPQTAGDIAAEARRAHRRNRKPSWRSAT
jgi:hypothetical protein